MKQSRAVLFCLLLATFAAAPAAVFVDYVGPAVRGSFEALDLVMEDGRRMPFNEVFRGYQPARGLFMRRLPLDKLDMRSVHEPELESLLLHYDANQNGWLEEPELTVFYIQETAKGFGYPVSHLVLAKRVEAMVAPAPDIAGLLGHIRRHTARLAPVTQRHFSELERIGRDEALEADGNGRPIEHP